MAPIGIRAHRLAAAAAAVAISAAALTACTSNVPSDAPAPTDGSTAINMSPDQNRIIAAKSDAIAAEVPAAIRDRGTLIVPTSAAQNQYPPLGFKATDNKTLIGVEVDIATLIAGVLGLELEQPDSSFEQTFLGIGSGKYDAAIGGLTVTDERIKQYDMAPYRKDLAAFEVQKGSGVKISTPEDAAGKSIAALAGSTMTTLLEQWNTQLGAKSLDLIDIKHYGSSSASQLAVQSGAIDAYLTIGAVADYVSTQPDSKIEIAGYPAEHGTVGTLSAQNSGLAPAMCDAINVVIENGQYAEVLARWNMQDYAIDKCELNTMS